MILYRYKIKKKYIYNYFYLQNDSFKIPKDNFLSTLFDSPVTGSFI